MERFQRCGEWWNRFSWFRIYCQKLLKILLLRNEKCLKLRRKVSICFQSDFFPQQSSSQQFYRENMVECRTPLDGEVSSPLSDLPLFTLNKYLLWSFLGGGYVLGWILYKILYIRKKKVVHWSSKSLVKIIQYFKKCQFYIWPKLTAI